MQKRIGIIDYGMGNLMSVSNALAFVGLEHFVSSKPSELDGASGLILPGVGAFPDAMKALDGAELSDFIRGYVKDRPLLGICLGMQLLFSESEEVETTRGLGLIEGRVIKLRAGIADAAYKIPHMGWNSLETVNVSSLLEGLGNEPYVYFVHSYKGVCAHRSDVAAVCGYGEEITAAVARGNVYGTQFHPEKSHKTGLKILKNFGGLL